MKSNTRTTSKQTTPEPMVVRPAQAAELIGVSNPHFRRLIASGEIRSFKSGRARLIPVAELDRWIRDRVAS